MKSIKNKNITVLYIAGNGHSGSTLLDIIIGSSPDIFSAGELTFITRDSIFEEYCSCGTLIKDCGIWSKVIEIWIRKSPVNLEDYKKLRLKFERNKTTARAFISKLNPSQDFKTYCEATLILFEAIQEVTGKSVIVDSSKSPQRIAVLNKIVDLKVIHLCRNAKGVLNSAKKSSKKDIKIGIEVDSAARRTSKTLLEWLFVNIITELFCIGVNSKKIKYKDYIQNLKIIETIHPKITIQNIQKFSTEHMMAGNILRLKEEVKVDTNLGFTYKRLSKKQTRIASLFERLFPFWA
jgi:hypothetical protein